MVTVQEATQIIQSRKPNLPIEKVDISALCGRILAEPIVADRDLPPFNRVAMDGIALNSRFFDSTRTYTIEATQAAGSPQLSLKDNSNCIEVMTGAMLPKGTDAVIRYEDLDIKNGLATVKLNEVTPFQNIHKQGSDAAANQTLLEPGQILSPAEVGILAATGNNEASVFSFPKTTLISNGDELTAIDQKPEPFQVRRSNVYALQAAIHSMGWHADMLHMPDNRNIVMKTLADAIVTNKVLILSGGVSKGKFDFVPGALEELGVKKLFHMVSQRPGKPFWVGETSAGGFVFAFPGNPVSTFLCFYRYVKPWIENAMGVKNYPVYASLEEDVLFEPSLTYFLQVQTRYEKNSLVAMPVPGGGSGDFVNLNQVNGFLELPAASSVFRKGEQFPFIPFR